MNDDITVRILQDIRETAQQALTEARKTNVQLEELRTEVHEFRDDVNERFDEVNERLDSLNVGFERVELELVEVKADLRSFKQETHANFGGVLMILGDSRRELDRRVTRIEEHLKLAP